MSNSIRAAVPPGPAGMLNTALQNSQDKQSENTQKHATAPREEKLRTFYANIDGCRFVFSNGHAATFTGGKYATDSTAEIEELEAVCKLHGNHMYSTKELPCLVKDMQILREVSARSGGSQVIQGAVNSVGIASLTPQ